MNLYECREQAKLGIRPLTFMFVPTQKLCEWIDPWMGILKGEGKGGAALMSQLPEEIKLGECVPLWGQKETHESKEISTAGGSAGADDGAPVSGH